jgi:hypothetical protein
MASGETVAVDFAERAHESTSVLLADLAVQVAMTII